MADDRGNTRSGTGWVFVPYICSYLTYHGFWSYCYFKTIFLKTCIFIIARSSLSSDQSTNLNNKIIHVTLHICRTYPPSTFDTILFNF